MSAPKVGAIRYEQKVRDLPDGGSEITDGKVSVWTGTEWVDVRELVAHWTAR